MYWKINTNCKYQGDDFSCPRSGLQESCLRSARGLASAQVYQNPLYFAFLSGGRSEGSIRFACPRSGMQYIQQIPLHFASSLDELRQVIPIMPPLCPWSCHVQACLVSLYRNLLYNAQVSPPKSKINLSAQRRQKRRHGSHCLLVVTCATSRFESHIPCSTRTLYNFPKIVKIRVSSPHFGSF